MTAPVVMQQPAASGASGASEKIAMTAPVVMQQPAGAEGGEAAGTKQRVMVRAGRVCMCVHVAAGWEWRAETSAT